MTQTKQTAEEIYFDEIKSAEQQLGNKIIPILQSDAIRKFVLNCLMKLESYKDQEVEEYKKRFTKMHELTISDATIIAEHMLEIKSLKENSKLEKMAFDDMKEWFGNAKLEIESFQKRNSELEEAVKEVLDVFKSRHILNKNYYINHFEQLLSNKQDLDNQHKGE